MKIASFDVETCQRRNGSICSVGVVLFDGGKEIKSYHSLVRPHESIYSTGWYFWNIHGINKWDVKYSPEFPDVYEKLYEFFNEADVVVAHNAAFDMGHLRGVLKLYDLPLVPFMQACSCKAAKTLHPELNSHKLNVMAEHFGWSFKHHDALEDARICGQLMCRLTQNKPAEEWAAMGVEVKQFN